MKTKIILVSLVLVSLVLIVGCKKDKYLPTIGICPEVVSTIPADKAIGIPLNQVVSATFNEKMNPATINTSSFTLTGTTVVAGTKAVTPVAGTISYSGTTVTFTPSSPLALNTTYTGTIKTLAKDLEGNALNVDHVWSFTTSKPPIVTNTDPSNNAVSVVLNKNITATFSVAMNPSTLTSASFIVKQGATVVAGTVSYAGTTVSFIPSAPFMPNKVYTVTLTTSASDGAGVPLAADYVWTFNTGISPTVISTDPANNASGVVFNKIVTATFSEPMDPMTLNATTFTLKQGTTAITGTISYAGSTVSFTPAVALSPGTIYIGTITTGAKNIAGLSLASDYVWTFTTAAAIVPTVTSADPANSAVSVGLNKVVTATFSVPMDPLTITGTTFTLKQGSTSIAGTVTYSGSTASFTPTSTLALNTIYTATITTGAKNVAGTALASDYIWTFTTIVAIPPTVTSTDPGNSVSGVALNKVVTATFSVPMDPLTITGTTFTLKQGSTSVAGTVTYSGSTASFTPTSALALNTIYTATITTGAKNVAGTALASDYIWTFTTIVAIPPTVTSTDPGNSVSGVALNKVVTAIFSVPMDPLTLTGTTFTLKQGATSIAGTVTYSGSTATFTPTVALAYNTVYTGTITTGAKNVAGTALASDYVWTFTTVAAVPPTVTSTDPGNSVSGVALNKVVTATFSVPMDPLTLTGTTFTLKQGATSIAGTVTYSGSTATFTPTVALAYNTVYTGTITTGAKNVAGTALASNYIWTFTTIAAVPPTVTSTDPGNSVSGVALNKVVTATFSVPMNPLTITGTTFTLKQGTLVIAGTVTYTGSTASFKPSSALKTNTIYTGTITTGAKNLEGTPLASNYIWTFKTVPPAPPTVVSTTPVNLATDVVLNQVISASFSTSMDPLTITSFSFTLKAGSTAVIGTVSKGGTIAFFIPSVDLLPSTTYTTTITTFAEDAAGTPLASDYVWTFTTGAVIVNPIVDLNSAAKFGILAGAGISNNAGFSVINNMDVGIYPGVRSSVTGFPPAIVVAGAIYASDDIAPPGTAAMLAQAKLDLVAAYDFAAGATFPAPTTVSGDQGGLTLAPGIYKSTSTLLIQSGDLTLDGKGDPNATWIFQIASGFTTIGGAGGNVILTGGAQAKNVFWQTGSSAVIGDNTTFYGNILALQSITMNSNAVATGRMLARNGSVVMTNTNTINKP